MEEYVTPQGLESQTMLEANSSDSGPLQNYPQETVSGAESSWDGVPFIPENTLNCLTCGLQCLLMYVFIWKFVHILLEFNKY